MSPGRGAKRGFPASGMQPRKGNIMISAEQVSEAIEYLRAKACHPDNRHLSGVVGGVEFEVLAGAAEQVAYYQGLCARVHNLLSEDNVHGGEAHWAIGAAAGAALKEAAAAYRPVGQLVWGDEYAGAGLCRMIRPAVAERPHLTWEQLR